MPTAWILVVYLLGSPVTAYTVSGFVAKMDCEKAGEELKANAKASRLPEHRFTCVAQPLTR